MSLLEARCSKCEYERKISADILRSYKLDESTDVTIPTTYGWCHGCSNVTPIEELPSIERIVLDIAAAGEVDPKWADRLRRLHRWRLGRRGPAKCLECGASEFDLFEFEENDDVDAVWERRPITHPKCGGVLTLQGIGFSRSGIWVFYSPEGEKLTSYDVYPSRGLVERPNDA
jgi:hypothetical protein